MKHDFEEEYDPLIHCWYYFGSPSGVHKNVPTIFIIIKSVSPQRVVGYCDECWDFVMSHESASFTYESISREDAPKINTILNILNS